jgi:hypothetical protein
MPTGQYFFDPRARAVVAVWYKPAGVVDLEILSIKAEKSHNRSLAMCEEVPYSAVASRVVRTMSICSSPLKTIRCEDEPWCHNSYF